MDTIIYGVPTPLRAATAAGVASRTSADPARRLRRDVCPQVMTVLGTTLPTTGWTSVETVGMTGAEKQLGMYAAATQHVFAHLPTGSTAQSPG